jgi:predicted lipoprotein
MNRFTHSIFLIISSFFFINSCGIDDDGTPTTKIEDARRQQIANFYDGFIVHQTSIHVGNTTSLFEIATLFQETPSQETLRNLKESWRIAFSTWKKIEPFNIGIIQESFIHSSIHTWPAATNEIENSIENTSTIDVNYISGIGAQRKGYAAIEYLLFDEEESNILAKFTTNPKAIKRSDYLIALTENLKNTTTNLNQLWLSYETDFKMDVSTSVKGNQNRLINAMIAQLEFIKNTKIEEALNTMNVFDLENYRSQFSKEAIQLNIEALRLVYTGNFNSNNTFGLEEYLSQTLERPALNEEVINAYTATISAFNAIPSSLENVITNEPALIETCLENLTTLIRLHKVDVASAANIIITFNDNDGD